MGDFQTLEDLPSPASRLELPLRPGEVVDGKYAITRLIGTGSMGFVFSAARPSLGDEVAIKVLRKESLSDAQLVARFAQEARVAARIKSEHVACVFDVGHLPDGAPFIVMERLEGKDLRWVLAERGTLPVELAVDYVLQVCEALAIAHANGITHRDIKPENLFASRQGQGDDVIKVLDFGISKMLPRHAAGEDKHALVKTTMAMGSPMYMSPEQLRAASDIDGRADIWALGCVLYELVTGNPAFSAPSLTELCALILESRPPAPGSLGLDVPPELEAIIGRCLEKDPRRRYPNIGELASALAPFAPARSLINIERCCEAQATEGGVDARADAATLPSFVPPGLFFDWKKRVLPWKRIATVGLGIGFAYIFGALLFAPHADPTGAVATFQQETQLAAAPPPPADLARRHELSPRAARTEPSRPEPESSAGASSPASTVSAQRTMPSPTKAAVVKSKPRPTPVSSSKEEVDVGF